MKLMEAFRSGQPDQAWEGTQQLLRLAKEMVLESAKDRFQKNFGSTLCENCNGLRAGPGVAATCFQIQQCYFDHVRVGASSRQLKVINSLLEPKKP